MREIRQAIRRLWRAPLFTTIVVATLALGIGANAAIFSVVNAVLLKPLPYRDPGQLVTIFHHYPSLKLDAPVSAPGFKDYRDRTHSFSNVAVETGWAVNLIGHGDPERLQGTRVSGDFFRLLGINPVLGRVVTRDDDQAGHDRVVVLSNALWVREFGARRDVIGQTMTINGLGYQVIGVMPASFVDPWAPRTELWSPLALDPALFVPGNYTSEYLNLTARLKPGVTADAAGREMAAFAARLKQDSPSTFSPDWTLTVQTIASRIVGNVRAALLILLGAVGFVLLIACANVANLLLARAASRQREVAVRTALGASRWDLARPLLAESLVLSLSGGLLGLAIAYGAIKALVAANPANLPRIDGLAVDGHVVIYTLVIAIGTGLIFGILPSLRVWRGSLHDTLKDNARGGTADRSGQRLRRSLVAGEVALALTLLCGSGLLLKSFAKLSGVDPGFTPGHLLTFTLGLPASRYPNDTVMTTFWRQVSERIAEVPGVTAAGATSVMPFGGGWSTGSFNIDGYTPPPRTNGPWGDLRVVTPGFFSALRIPGIAGRTFTDGDIDSRPSVAVVDEEFVHRFFPAGTNVIGKRIWFGNPAPDTSTRYITIVGVVGHAAHEGLDADRRVQVYFSAFQPTGFGAQPSMDFAVRTTGDPLRATASVRRAIYSIDAQLPMARIHTMDELISISMGQRRLSMVLLGIFAGLALLLASLGIYGIMSYAVTQRTRELGVRMALGASRDSVLRMVLGQGLAITAVGGVIGVVAALALTRLIRAQLYDVAPNDPVIFAGVVVLLAAIAGVATLIPAWRATRVDPIVALRQE